MVEPQLSTLTRSERDQILRGLYYRAIPDERSDISAHIFTADYFGMMILNNKKQDGEKKTYRVEIIEEHNVKWNFFHGRDDIDPSTSSGDWVSYTSRSFPE
ncbi:hypothetical protein GCK32_021909, partial [Trichostrongylus colubriformis]